MTYPRILNNKFFNIVWIPFWAGLLVLPFTGAGKAIRIFAVAVGLMFLWRLSKHDAFTTLRNAAAKKISKISAVIMSFTRYA